MYVHSMYSIRKRELGDFHFLFRKELKHCNKRQKFYLVQTKRMIGGYSAIGVVGRRLC
jgi:hypothetical protein